jgi:hypothetical protein
MNPRDSTKDMLEFASAATVEEFARCGRVSASWFTFTDDCDVAFTVPPPPVETEAKAIEMLSQLFDKMGVVAYAFVAENAGRDAVVIAVEARDGFALAHKKITRASRDRPGRLGPIVVSRASTIGADGFVGFVPRAGRRQ